jgi:hypothetical protein
VNPDLEARHIAASAVLDDFRSDLAGAPLTSPPPMATYAFRLASVLGDVLAAVSRETATPPIVLEALADAVRWQGSQLGWCRDCRPGRPCAGHQGCQPSIEAYRDLTARLNNGPGQPCSCRNLAGDCDGDHGGDPR